MNRRYLSIGAVEFYSKYSYPGAGSQIPVRNRHADKILEDAAFTCMAGPLASLLDLYRRAAIPCR